MKKIIYVVMLSLSLFVSQSHATNSPFQQFEGKYKLIGIPLAEDNGDSTCRIFRGFTGFQIYLSTTYVGYHTLMAFFGTNGHGLTATEDDYLDEQNPNILIYGHSEGYSGFAKYNRMMLGNPEGGNYRVQYMFSGSGPKYRVTIIHESISRRGIPLAGCYFSAELEKQ